MLVLAGCGDRAGEDVSSAGCHGPWIDTSAVGEPPQRSDPAVTVRPGGTVRLHGHGYTSACNDTGEQEELEPLGPVEVSVRLPGGGILRLGELTPRVEGTDVGFVATATVPAGTPAGTAVVRDDRSPATTFRFTVAP